MISIREVRLARDTDAAPIALLSREAIEYGLGWKWTPERVRRCIEDGVRIAKDLWTPAPDASRAR